MGRRLPGRERLWLGALTIVGAVALSCFSTAGASPGAIGAALAGSEGKLVFVASPGGSPELYAVDTAGSVVAPLGRHPIIGSAPRWSPDGENLAFVSDREGNPELYVVDARGLAEQRLTTNRAADLHPSWASVPAEIVFQRGVGARAEIELVDEDTGAERRLTRNRVGDYDPAAAPTIGRVVFGRAGDLYRLTLRGTGLARITRGKGVDSQPAWGRTGRIAFVRSSGPESDLYTVLPNGRGEKQLTSMPGRTDSSPAWSPLGDKIVFRACTSATTCQLEVINADGSGERPFLQSAALDGADPDWQPIPAGRTWDAAADFLTSPDQDNPSPDAWGERTWSYLYGEGLVHDPSMYRLLPDYVIGDADREQWQATAFVNLLIGIVRSQQRLVMHSWGGRVGNDVRSATLAWRSPLDGNVTVAGSISLPSVADCPSGSGTLWSIDRGPTTLQSGVLAAGGAATFSVSASVRRGDTIYFVHDPGYDSNCDTGLLQLTITQSSLLHP